MIIKGACHCGNIRLRLRWPATGPEIPVRRCRCTFCSKHGGAWTSHPESSLTVEFDDRSRISPYRFGTETADFYVCSVCGAVPLVVSLIDGSQYAVVNANTFEDIEGISFSSTNTNFDGEELGDRLERRKQNWIPDVWFNTPPG